VKIYYNVPLAPYTTIGIGGAARLFISAESEQDILNVAGAYETKKTPLYVLGGGSNLLVSDKGIDGTVLHIGRGFDKIEVCGDTIKAEAGARLSRLSAAAQRAELSGLEFAAHIPGTVGGAVFMNAGAYGADISRVTETVSAVSREGGADGLYVKSYNKTECGFTYRSGVFQASGAVITGAVLRLKKGRAEDIKKLTDEYLLRRKTTQPQGVKSAGSVFKAVNGVPAAKYIDALSLKGYCVGGAAVSEKHANFIVNTGGAACADVQKLINVIKEKVWLAYGVRLDTEIKII